ncbi:hypothetical protein GIB67_025694 [Kingdonia uniflora]|uniref:CrcB-like protein n=1 Tax=Kingdonia uniflora TaxID=39325 RepID=A0A7J7P2V4_9MAGN|nr:hypothetical protein GIB67_025694 [Kingdonia uniflora]
MLLKTKFKIFFYAQSHRHQKESPQFTPDPKENQSEWPRLLEYISCLLHLAVFGILGVFTRYFLQKLFGPTVAGITSNQSVLYLDLPSNVVLFFKGDICQVSDLLAIGLTTGYLGSLTTFSGWNQKMLDLSVKGQWVTAVLGFLVIRIISQLLLENARRSCLWIVAESLRTGVETAKGFRFLLKRFTMNSESVKPNPRWNYRVDGFKQHLMVMVMMVLLLGFLWGVSGTLLRKRLYDGNSNAQLWLACIVAPPGVWARWFFARFNGRGLGKKGVLKWIPFGTLLVNVSAASVMAALSTVKKEASFQNPKTIYFLLNCVNTKKCDIIVTGIQFGLLGCLSTVSTFIAEYHAMRESKYPWRAHAYAAITILPSFIIGTLIYSIPVWTKVHH